jgi:hypothetical protein
MRGTRVIGAVLVLAFLTSADGAGGKKTPETVRAAGRLFSPVGTLLVRENASAPWTLPALYDAVHSGDQLIALPGAKAVLELKEGDVRLSLLGNLPELSAAPVLETALVLHGGKDFAIDATLDRGRLLIESRIEKGPIRVRLRFKDNLDLALEPGASVAVERYSAWPPGARFVKTPKKDHVPDVEVTFLVLKGKVDATFQGERHALEAPVQYHWSTLRGVEGPLPLRTPPAWLKPSADTSKTAAAAHAAVEKLRRKLAEHKQVPSFKGMLDDKDDMARAVNVLSAGAAGDLDLVLAALEDGKQAAARRAAIIQLRHFTSRGAAQESRLYELLKEKKFAPGEAEIVLQLLHRFGPRDLAQPETYEALINYLASPKVAVRELGHWHLVRLVPAGKSIPFDAGATPDTRAAAQAAWRKLIPPGELPKRGKE